MTRARKASVRVNFNPRSHEGSDRLPGGDAMINGISIHAPTRGATRCRQHENSYQRGFQSTLPRGERRRVYRECHGLLCISIHAPTRGATISVTLIICWFIYFNPRSHEGSDVSVCVSRLLEVLFQSTLPRGERQYPLSLFRQFHTISIHAPTRGATKLVMVVI